MCVGFFFFFRFYYISFSFRQCIFFDSSSPSLILTPPVFFYFILSSSLGFTLQVGGTVKSAEIGLKQHLERLDEIFATRPDYLQTLHYMQLMVNNVIRELTVLPDISKASADLATIADQTAFIEYYR